MNKFTQIAWVEKYRPRTVNECILPSNTKKNMTGFVESGKIPNLLLSGSAGTGKTTSAIALCNELDYEYLLVNGSLEVNMDALRNSISQFASTMSFDGRRKCVIIDEADHLSYDKVQPALRGFIEQFASNCSFILTCNFPNRLMDALISRSARIDFAIPTDERANLTVQMFKRVCEILSKENITFDQKAVGLVVTKHFPDFRRTLNALQLYAASGSIDAGILVNTEEAEINNLITILKEKNFREMRKWVASTPNVEMTSLCRRLYDKAYDVMVPDTIPQLVLDLADYQYRHHFVTDAEINIAAMLTTIMTNCEFK